MIRYLQKMRARKGFTMAELIIVIAIMAILMAMILPMFSNDDAEKDAAETYASDFYAALQYNMTRYQLTEYHLTPQLQTVTEQYLEDIEAGATPSVEPYIYYDESKGANVFTADYLFIEVAYDKGIEYVKVHFNLKALIGDAATASNDPIEMLLEKDLKDVMNQAGKGHYYAVVQYEYDDPTPSAPNNGDEVGYGDLKVKTAHYCEEALPAVETEASYTTDNLIFTGFSELKCGIICGTCSSDDCDDSPSATKYTGTLGSYFLNVRNVGDNTVIVDA